MPKQTTNQLKLYTEQESSVYTNGDGDVIERLCSAFTQLTGYRLTFDAHLDGEPTDEIAAGASFALPDGMRQVSPTLELAIERESDELGAVESSIDTCRHFAETLSEFVTRLQVTRASLREREGELAAAVPLVCDPEVDRHQVADRLEAVLGAGVNAVGMTSAALFILDDFTQHLKLRAHWGLSDDRFVAPPRVLKTATADLEALVGHAVVLDKPTAFASWNAPESFGSAVCVPVSTATVPLGTLWFFDESPRKYDDAEVGLIEVIAGRIAAELEREILLRSKLDGHAPDDAISHDWSKLAWPAVAAPAGWQVTGVANEDQSLPNGCLFHQRDGKKLHASLVTVHEEGLRAGMLTAGIL
ncbi:MAG: GAF domain-containing protein, partial [Planctomycetota bacterium]